MGVLSPHSKLGRLRVVSFSVLPCETAGSLLRREARATPPSGGNISMPPAKGSLRKFYPLIGAVVLFLGVIVLAVGYSSERRFIQLLTNMDAKWICAAVGLQVTTYLDSALAWRVALSSQGKRVPLLEFVQLGLAKLFTDQAVPLGGVSGALLMVHALGNRGVERAVCLGIFLLVMVSYYTGYALMVGAALIVLFVAGDMNDLLLGMAVAFGAVAIIVPGVVFWIRRHPGHKLPKFVTRLPGVPLLLQALGEASSDLIRNRRLFITVSLLQASVIILDGLTLWIMLKALGLHLGIPQAFASFVMASVVATLTISPGGLGSFEGGCVAMLHIFGVPLDAGLTATLLLRGFTFWLPMLPGMWFAHREMGWRRTHGHKT
ncbi:flippase-like domain-containing protein [Oceanidesulfovibrio marinus]|uniref:Flippase-like domain-containing protein n=1 Tax=Oceanidesulfovibrio marinus TaxID=370038 RepID=A0ABX6NDU9_9BACT|nr:flippase-like domain-containing protein [Oceanidesulfovibrio marinus]